MELDKPQEAMAALQEGLDRDPYSTGDELMKTLVPALTPQKKQQEMLAILARAIAYCPDDPNVVEALLKQRITTLNGMKQYAAALGDARSLFNVATMSHTSDAITVLDRQFLLPNMEDRGKVEQFRAEQTAGAAPRCAGVDAYFAADAGHQS